MIFLNTFIPDSKIRFFIGYFIWESIILSEKNVKIYLLIREYVFLLFEETKLLPAFSKKKKNNLQIVAMRRLNH